MKIKSKRKMYDPTFVKTGAGYEWVFSCRKVSYYTYKYALKHNVIEIKHVCEECQDHHNIHAHHDDYKYPLRIRYLCAKCHSFWHHNNGAGLHRDTFCKKRFFSFDELLSNRQIDICFEEIYEEAKKMRRNGEI